MLAGHAVRLQWNFRGRHHFGHEAVLEVIGQKTRHDNRVRLIRETVVYLLQIHHLADVFSRHRQRGHARLRTGRDLVIRDDAVDQDLRHNSESDPDDNPIEEIQTAAVEQRVIGNFAFRHSESHLEAVAGLVAVGYPDARYGRQNFGGRRQRNRRAGQQQQANAQFIIQHKFPLAPILNL